MILSDYIKALQAIEAEHGGAIEVKTPDDDGDLVNAFIPYITYMVTGSIYSELGAYNGEDRKGQKVVRV
jgi:hypothetical protein